MPSRCPGCSLHPSGASHKQPGRVPTEQDPGFCSKVAHGSNLVATARLISYLVDALLQTSWQITTPRDEIAGYRAGRAGELGDRASMFRISGLTVIFHATPGHPCPALAHSCS